MFKTPEEYAEMLLALYYGDKEGAKIEVYNAAKAFPKVPCRFWYDVANAIDNA